MRNLFTALFLMTVSVFLANAQDVTFKASAERTVVAGQPFRLSFTLTHSTNQQPADFQAPANFGGLEKLYGPTQQSGSSTTIMNGKSSSNQTLSLIYTMSAPKEGEYKIDPATIKLGNSQYTSNTLTIKALPPDQTPPPSTSGTQQSTTAQTSASIDEMVFVRAVPSKTTVYENEGLLVSFKLYALVDIQVENVKFPEFDGFIAQEIDNSNPQWMMEHYNGRNYRTAVLKQSILFPQKDGKLTIPPGKFDIVAMIRSQRRTRSFFDDFFETTQPVKKTITTNPVAITVKPLPQGKPASFNGAAGEYKMTSTISRTELKANDAVTIKVTISGSGNIKLIKNPEIIFPNDFEVYDPVVNTSTKVSQSGVTGTRTIEYNAIPRYGGDFTIPKAEFSYFDLKTNSYRTLTTDEFTLHVEQGEAGSSPSTVVNATSKEALRFVGQDIRYIRTGKIDLYSGQHFFGTAGYFLWYIFPSLLFIVFFIIYRKQAAENSNIALIRTKKANKVASRRLKTAAAYLKDNKQEQFYDETLKAVWGYLSDKLNIPVAALTKDNVEANLTQSGAGEDIINQFREILDTAEFARFAPAQGSGAMDELYKKTVDAIDKMESTIIKKHA